MMKNYDGTLGNFVYDEDLWEVGERVRYIGPLNCPIDIPSGITSYAFMFSGLHFEEGAYIRSCGAKLVTDVTYMFDTTVLPKGFILGDNFFTENITWFDGMFKDASLPEGFTLGRYFDTSSAIDMSEMFSGIKFPESFTLGEYFDTSKVEDFTSMFAKSTFNNDFTLGKNFDTSSAISMQWMFNECVMNDTFTLGDKFNTSKVETMRGMFRKCKMSFVFNLGGEFDTSAVIDMHNMFAYCKLPSNFSFGNMFNTEKTTSYRGMLHDTYWPDGTPCDCGEDHEDYLMQVYKFIHLIDSSYVVMSQERARDYLREIRNSINMKYEYKAAIDLILRPRKAVDSICPNCITILGEGDIFCHKCGQKVRKD